MVPTVGECIKSFRFSHYRLDSISMVLFSLQPVPDRGICTLYIAAGNLITHKTVMQINKFGDLLEMCGDQFVPPQG